ncbi:ABC transporter permease [Dactylosporangium siamense]|uniref:ABC transporter permease n=1 Tax=Dactylosporangium siamense TaxID=685454 RepID=A0A919PWL2_9ACTN|nr:ABC transporter permease [Dactylosporangium siamense]GIG49943.1 ABC transporter permease [Dactylosporangium siamense]
MNTSAATRLVAGRELKVKLRDKTFVFSTLFFLLFAVGATVLPAMFGGGPSSVAVADESLAPKLREAGLKVRVVADPERLVRDGDVDAAVVAGPQVLAMTDAPGDVVRALSTEPEVRLLDPDAVEPVVGFLVAFVFAMVFFFTSLTFGLQIAQSVTEEKQTRMVEILVAAVPVRALLAGKVLAGGILALAQVALIALVTIVGAQLTDGGSDLLPVLAPALVWFVPFFVFGFVMLAALWAAVGALVNRQEDIGGASTPVQLVVMLPFFAVIFLRDNALVMTIMSYVPFSSPTAMPVRLFDGDAAGWEPFVSLAVLAISAAVTLAAGARLYEGSLLRTNGRTSWASAWRDREMQRL